MIVGVPKEIKDNEKRVSLTPFGATERSKQHHTVLIEKNAGLGSGFNDNKYIESGAIIVENSIDIFSNTEPSNNLDTPTTLDAPTTDPLMNFRPQSTSLNAPELLPLHNNQDKLILGLNLFLIY